MNIKRYLLSAVAAFVFAFLYEWLFHGLFLQDSYNTTAQLWRSPEQMQEFFPIAIAIEVVFVFFLAFLFTRNYQNKGIAEGFRFGLYIGLFMGIMMLSFYPYMPIPLCLATSWFLGTLFEGIGIGIVLSLVYRK